MKKKTKSVSVKKVISKKKVKVSAGLGNVGVRRWLPWTLLGAGLVFVFLVLAMRRAEADTKVVTVLDPGGWYFANSFNTAEWNGNYSGYVYGPATPPGGTGSAIMGLSPSSTSRLVNEGYAGTKLGDFVGLSYFTYRKTEDVNNKLAQKFMIQVDYDLTDNSNPDQGWLVYDPAKSEGVAGTVVANVWNKWEPMLGMWYATGGDGVAQCPIDAPCTWTMVKEKFPNAGVIVNGAVALVGENPGVTFESAMDLLTINTTASQTTYDFEVVPYTPTPTISSSSSSSSSSQISDRDGDGVLDNVDFCPDGGKNDPAWKKGLAKYRYEMRDGKWYQRLVDDSRDDDRDDKSDHDDERENNKNQMNFGAADTLGCNGHELLGIYQKLSKFKFSNMYEKGLHKIFLMNAVRDAQDGKFDGRLKGKKIEIEEGQDD